MRKIWMVIFVGMVVLDVLGNREASIINHNGEKHAALCAILRSAVAIVQSGRGGNKLQKALRQAIYGSETGTGSMEGLIGTLLQGFNHHGSRENWCGKCLHDRDHYPGKSIPQDLLCVCTMGEKGHPFTGSGSANRLCGQSAPDLVCGGGSGYRCQNLNDQGWTDSSDGSQAQDHVSSTWDKVVQPCLQAHMKINLEEARNTLLEKVKIEGESSSPIWARGHSHGCKGNSGGICVDYHTCKGLKEYPQWWDGLYATLATADFTQPKVTSAAFTNVSSEHEVVGEPPNPNEDQSQGTHQESHRTQEIRKGSTNPISHLTEKKSRSISSQPVWILFALLFY